MKKMTMKGYEKSSMDKRADKSGAHGKEGSAKDRMMDKKAVNKINAGMGMGRKGVVSRSK